MCECLKLFFIFPFCFRQVLWTHTYKTHPLKIIIIAFSIQSTDITKTYSYMRAKIPKKKNNRNFFLAFSVLCSVFKMVLYFIVLLSLFSIQLQCYFLTFSVGCVAVNRDIDLSTQFQSFVARTNENITFFFFQFVHMDKNKF